MKRRLASIGISHDEWRGGQRLSIRTSILLVQVELATTSGFLAALEELKRENRLARIVVDEAHLALTWSEFRPAMERLVWLRTLAVPMVLLSASVRPQWEGDLEVAFVVSRTIIATVR